MSEDRKPEKEPQFSNKVNSDEEARKELPAKKERTRTRELKEREQESELSEQGMYVDILGRLAVAESDKNKLLELYDKARHREGQRRNDFELSQRQYMWFMMADKERDMGHIRNTQGAFIELVNKYAETKQADAKSKITEVVEVATAVLSMPIFVELQTLLMDKLRKKRPLDDPKKEKARRELQRQIAALEEDPEE